MILAVAATEMEAASFRAAMDAEKKDWDLLISGVGILESAVNVSAFLAANHSQVKMVVQFGVGGAYLAPPEVAVKAGLLSLCLAESETLGDLGVELGDRIEYFSRELVESTSFQLNPGLIKRAGEILSVAGHEVLVGKFITVNCASGTRQRGEMLRSRWDGLCENMEGAAVARICAQYDVPMVEIRAISNMVEDRNLQNWQLGRACEKAGQAAALLVKELL